MIDPVIGWVLGTAALIFCAVIIGLYIHYLRNKQDVKSSMKTLLQYPGAKFDLDRFHYDTMEALANSPKKDDLIREFAYMEGRGGHKVFTPRLWAKSYNGEPRGEYSTAYFMRTLVEAFDEIELIRHIDTEDRTRHGIYKLHRGEEFCYIEVGSINVQQLWKGKEDKPIYHSDNFTVDHYLDEKGEISILCSNQHGYALRILLPVEQSNFKYELIIEALAASAMKAAEYHEPLENKAIIHKLTIGQGGGYALREIEIDAISLEDASMYYSDVQIAHGGNTLSLTADGVIALGCTTLLNGENASIFGPAGCGKTRIAAEIARRLSNTQGVDVIMLDPSTVSSLSDVTRLAMFEAALDSQLPSESLKVLLLDEAETLLRKGTDGMHSTDNTFMLSILDGMQSTLRNTAVLMTFNAGPETLNEKIFRPGRIRYCFQMQGINKTKADALVTHLKGLKSFEDKVFDAGAYAKLFNGKDITTVAEVTRCFLTQDENEILTKDLELLATNPNHAKVMLARIDELKYKKRKNEGKMDLKSTLLRRTRESVDELPLTEG